MKTANRFAVFRSVQDYMHANGECPTARQVARKLDMNPAIVAGHMRALKDADGLPFAIPDGAWRSAHNSEANATKGSRENYYTRDVFEHFERMGCA